MHVVKSSRPTVFITTLSLSQGFCGWALVNYDRLLIPANPDIGVLRYRDHYYAFSSKPAAYEFAGNIELWVMLITRNFIEVVVFQTKKSCFSNNTLNLQPFQPPLPPGFGELLGVVEKFALWYEACIFGDINKSFSASFSKYSCALIKWKKVLWWGI